MRANEKAALKHLILRVVFIAIIVYVVFTYGFLITQCHGQNMFPAMKDGDLCIVFRTEAQSLFHEKLKQDDVVAYQANGKRYFGRVVAVAGDVVMLDDSGALIVNGVTEGQEIMYPTYAKEGTEYPLRVPEDHVFLLGDYRTHTTDSRDIGTVSMEDVEGKVITILRRRGL